MSEPAPRHGNEDEPALDPEHFLREFPRRMAEQGLIVRMPATGSRSSPWIFCGELSAMVGSSAQGRSGRPAGEV
jgi:hypothetical protein